MADLQPMYPGMPGSPETSLASAITDTATSLTVASGAALPEAPNLLTISSGELFETVLYTAKSGNTVSGLTRGINGPARSWSANAIVARNMSSVDLEALQENVRQIADSQKESAALTRTLSQGQTIIEADQGSGLSVVVLGQTRYNLLGSAGGCETLTGWTLTGTGVTLSTTIKRSGTNSIRCQPTVSQVSYAYKDFAYPLDSAKQYIFAAWVYVESFTSGGLSITVRDYGTNTQRYVAPINTSIIGAWQLVYVKIPTGHTIVGNGFRVLFGSTTSGDLTVYFDEIRVIEVTAAEYAAIGTTINGEDVDRLIPYIDGMQSVRGVSVAVKGRNLLPPLSAWTLHSNAMITGPYALTLNATSSQQRSTITIPTIPGQQYTMRTVMEGPSNNQRMKAFNGAGTGGTLLFSSMFLTESFTAQSGLTTISLENQAGAGLFTFAEFVLVLGDTSALPPSFVPQEDQRHIADVTLPSLPGGIRDIYYADRGEVWRAIKEETVTTHLSTSLSGTNNDLYQLVAGAKGDVALATDSAGMPLAQTTYALRDSVDSRGKFYVATGNLWLIVAKGSTPTYPYRVLYGVNNPGFEPVPHNGALTVHPGSNIVEIRTGVVRREKANPVLLAGNGRYYINAVNVSAKLANRTAQILRIYREANADDKWVFVQHEGANRTTYGDWQANIAPGDYDPNAEYYVDYLVLDRYAYTTAVNEATATFGANLGSVVGANTEDIARLKAHDDTQDWIITEDGAHIDNLRIDVDALTPRVDDLETDVDAVESGLSTHTGRTDNPHGVTKTQVGLGAVQNYGIATQAQAEAGTATNVYPTPQRVKQYVDTRMLNNVSLRINAGALEYNDGTGWKAVASGNDYEPLAHVATVEGLTLNNWQTALELTGEGEIHEVFCGQGSGSSARQVRITVDGVVKVLVANNTIAGTGIACGFFTAGGISMTDTGALRAKGNTSNIAEGDRPWGYTGGEPGRVISGSPISFKTSFRVEVRISVTSGSGPFSIFTRVRGGVK